MKGSQQVLWGMLTSIQVVDLRITHIHEPAHMAAYVEIVSQVQVFRVSQSNTHKLHII